MRLPARSRTKIPMTRFDKILFVATILLAIIMLAGGAQV
jgi:hypothetical protein